MGVKALKMCFFTMPDSSGCKRLQMGCKWHEEGNADRNPILRGKKDHLGYSQHFEHGAT
jgi:hypothetical protein